MRCAICLIRTCWVVSSVSVTLCPPRPGTRRELVASVVYAPMPRIATRATHALTHHCMGRTRRTRHQSSHRIRGALSIKAARHHDAVQPSMSPTQRCISLSSTLRQHASKRACTGTRRPESSPRRRRSSCVASFMRPHSTTPTPSQAARGGVSSPGAARTPPPPRCAWPSSGRLRRDPWRPRRE